MKTLPAIIRKYAYLTASIFDMTIQKPDIILLCYHSITEDSWRFSISLDTLKKQVDYLLTIRNPITLDDLALYLDGKKEIDKPSFIMTFDDGYKNIFQTIPYFKEKNINPTLFILSDPDHANRAELENQLPFLSINEIKTLKKAGWNIAVHSATHADFGKLTDTDKKNEIMNSKQSLVKEFGFPLLYFSYPKGRYSDEIVKVVKDSGYTLAVSMDDGLINKETNRYAIPRIGVDATHDFDEFKVLFSPSVIKLRGALKKTFIANFF